MLAKIWKKLLLAICIIACLFNVTYKLVNRISLEKVISTQQEGVDVKKLLNIVDEPKVVTDKVSKYNVVDNNMVSNTSVTDENGEEEQVNPEEQPVENPEENPEEVSEPEESKSMTVTDFIDRVIDGSFNN